MSQKSDESEARFHSAPAEEGEEGGGLEWSAGGGGGEKGAGRSVSFFILWVIPTATGEKLMSAFQIYDAFPCALNVDFVTLGDTLKT